MGLYKWHQCASANEINNSGASAGVGLSCDFISESGIFPLVSACSTKQASMWSVIPHEMQGY